MCLDGYATDFLCYNELKVNKKGFMSSKNKKGDDSNNVPIYGIVSVVFGGVSYAAFGLIFSILGIIFGCMGLSKDKQTALATIGLVLSLIALAFVVIGLFMIH